VNLALIKLGVYAAVLALAVFVGWRVHTAVWTSGYNAAWVLVQSEAAKAADEAVAKARANWELSEAAGKEELAVENNISRGIRDAERHIAGAVSAAPGKCTAVGEPALGVLNDTVDAANGN
jgi:hypothetical protein